jgi:hypothetical protein
MTELLIKRCAMFSRFTMFVMIVISLCWQCACAGRTITGDRNVAQADNSQVRSMVNIIEDINSNAPKSFMANFVVEGRMANNKKFKSLGEVAYSSELKKMKIAFLDSVFRSPVTIILQEDRSLKFYLPVDKKLYLDNADTINLKNYVDVRIDYGFLSSLASGRIPLIPGYTVKQGISQQDAKSDSAREYYIILENSNQYETISMKDNIPGKIMLLNKATNDRMEFYLENPVRDNNVLYYKSIRFISLQTGDRISVMFNSLKFNPRINAGKDLTLSVPKNTQVIRFQ